jgi:hypothetical protein
LPIPNPTAEQLYLGQYLPESASGLLQLLRSTQTTEKLSVEPHDLKKSNKTSHVEQHRKI